jgi:hypothetical protein
MLQGLASIALTLVLFCELLVSGDVLFGPMQVVARTTLMLASYLCLYEASLSWLPVPWPCAGPLAVGRTSSCTRLADLLLFYSSVFLLLWSTLREWGSTTQGPGRQVVMPSALATGAILRTAAALLLFNAAASQADTSQAGSLAKQLCDWAEAEAAASGALVPPLPPQQHVAAVVAVAQLLTRSAMPRAAMLMAARASGHAWHLLLSAATHGWGGESNAGGDRQRMVHLVRYLSCLCGPLWPRVYSSHA